MTTALATEYELVLMLDPEAPDAQRDKIVADTRGRIESSGQVKQDSAWGLRKMAYEIRQRTEADYRFFRFEGDPELLGALDHDLKIVDGVLRFRIFKVDARLPVITPPAPTPGSGPPPRPGRRDADDGVPAAAEPAAEAEAPSAEAEAPAEVAETPAEVADAPAEEAAAPEVPAPEEAPATDEAPPAEEAPAAEEAPSADSPAVEGAQDSAPDGDAAA